jgi:hypothetical protein
MEIRFLSGLTCGLTDNYLNMPVSDTCLRLHSFELIETDHYYDLYPVYCSLIFNREIYILVEEDGCIVFLYENWNEGENRTEHIPISATICNDEDFEIALKYFDLGAII